MTGVDLRRGGWWTTVTAAALVAAAAVAWPQEKTEDAATRAARLVADVRQAWVTRVALVAARGAVDEPLKALLMEKAAKEGVTLTIVEVDPEAEEQATAQIGQLRKADIEAILPMGAPRQVEAILQIVRNLALTQPALLYEADAQGKLHLVKKGVMPVFDAVMGQKRPTLSDILILKNGAVLTGQITNTAFRLRTAYAAELKLGAFLVAGVLFEPDTYTETVFTVNANRLTGWIEEPALTMTLANGTAIAVRKENVGKLIFHLRDNELRGVARGSLVVLTNGDVLTGQVRPTTLHVLDSQGHKQPVELAKVRRLTMLPGKATVASFRLKDGPTTIQGPLAEDELEIGLDLGLTVKVYRDRIREIAFQPGYPERLDLVALGAGGVAPRLGEGTESLVQPVPPAPPEKPPIRSAADAMEMMEAMHAAHPIFGRVRGDRYILNTINMTLVLMPPGSFEMGSKDGSEDEKPVHTVQITRPFYISATEVTQAQWQVVMGTLPYQESGPDLPVTYVSWLECQQFCKLLTDRERKIGKLPLGMAYRLPTEAEWEYACLAGSNTAYHFGNDPADLGKYAWYAANSQMKVQAVRRKMPSAWGLYDMHGNVWEWCQDWYAADYYAKSPAADPPGPQEGSARVVRGGAWKYEAAQCRAANRSSCYETYRSPLVGFRVVLAPTPLE